MERLFFWLKNNPIKSVLILLLIGLVFKISYILIFDPYRGIGGGAAHIYNMRSGDLTRARNLASLRLSLEIYKDKYKTYPPNLEKLVDEKFIEENYIRDPATNNIYEYVSGNNGQDYIIKIPYGLLPEGVKLNRHLKKAGEYLTAEKLKRDLDGIIYGINCDDPAYCASSKIP